MLTLPPHPDEQAPAQAQDADVTSGRGPAALAGAPPGLALVAPVSDTVSEEVLAAPAGSPLLPYAEVKELNARAVARYAAKDYVAAVDLLVRVVNLCPESFAAHGNYAIALRRAQRPAEAEAHARRALALKPDYAQGYKLLAELLAERRDLGGALAAHERLSVIEPNNVTAQNNYGLLLRKNGKLDEARAAFSRALALSPEDPRIRFNLLALDGDDAKVDEAIALCRRSLEQSPDDANVLTNMALCQQFAGHFDEALRNLTRAFSLTGNREAAFNLSLLQLLRGDYELGWRNYEERWQLIEVTKPAFPQPEWHGENLDGRTILIQSEQGFGDAIQSLRYIPLVAKRGGRVLMRLDRPLVRLAASLPSNVVIMPNGSTLPPFDLWCPMLSLPGLCNTRLETIPPAPYLHVRSAIVERWRRRLAGLEGLRIGLVWGGNPVHVNDLRRSIGLERLKPLLATQDASFVSLQVGPRAGDVAAMAAGAIVDLSSELSDFAETAGAILNLDLVIAVDTAVVHLAGALGRPAWVMLPFSPDWRWMLGRDDSPWYPSLKLYRQGKPGDWEGVVRRVVADLALLATAHADGLAIC